MIIPKDKYPAQTDDTDPTGYPHGAARNANSPNDGNGFPLEKEWVNDVLGFFQALAEAAGITPSGDPEKVGESDLLDALDALYYRRSLIDSAIASAVAVKVTAGSARYRITNSSVNPVTFSSATSGVLTSTGFSLEDSGQSIQVPAAGRYLVSWSLYTRTTSTANPVGMRGSLRVGGVDYQTKDGSRWNATESDLIIMADTALVEIATPASERLSLVVSAFDGTPSILNESTPGTHWLSVARVS